MSTEMFTIIKQDLAVLEKDLLSAVTSPINLITEIGTHLVHSGGKRLRPALYFLAAHCGKNFVPEKIMPMAVALEIIHMASLVHDDVIDHADLRRGTSTANAKWGNQVAVLSGDYLFSKAFSLLVQHEYDKRVGQLLCSLICDLSSGEIIQNREIYKACRDEENYYDRIAKKTADFLAICCEIGGIVGEADPEEIKGLHTYGYSVGMAFQITDDLLDITSSAETIGKPVGNDILQGIVTLPVIRALQVSPEADVLEKIVTNRQMTPQDLARALTIVRATDGLSYAQHKAEAYIAEAKAALPSSLPPAIRETFLTAASFIGNRQS